MLTLGIETSCDETACAVIKNSNTVLASCVSSSIHMHRKFGGIVPEIASRFHLEYITLVVEDALKKADLNLSDIDLIAATYAPGLVGSLLVGLSFAKAISLAINKPFLGVNHIHAHMFAPFIQEKKFQFPFIGLTVSGGHTSLALVKDFDNIKIIGNTRDDAAGEAYDKVAKLLELPYPGGPQIDKLASSISLSPFQLKCAKLENSFDFSFSGIKTDVLYTWNKLKIKNKKAKTQIAHAFQKQVVEILVTKSIAACKKHNINCLSVGGGVACNSFLRKQLQAAGKQANIQVLFPNIHLCLDNAAMIGVLGYHLFKKGKRSKYSLSASAST
ncbi:MAG: tRNA (adenosine(37)-N6)-threonylcarbamoyltransferase complex transferase subunit TsaD [Candidatus Omnitrophica bacterium]|nr:tRNA (adenosine(37)-N6)-threonylcarbamoyltransferase complex transferase subunit TsaD [Candidatus Omnitrophota bacterium]